MVPSIRDFIASRSASRPRREALERLLGALSDWLAPCQLSEAAAGDISAFFEARLDHGFHPNTVRKWLIMVRSYYAWLYGEGALSAETLLAIRELRFPVGASGTDPPETVLAR